MPKRDLGWDSGLDFVRLLPVQNMDLPRCSRAVLEGTRAAAVLAQAVGDAAGQAGTRQSSGAPGAELRASEAMSAAFQLPAALPASGDAAPRNAKTTGPKRRG